MGRFVADDAGFDRWATGADVERFIRAVGDYWAGRLLFIAPDVTGEYKRSIEVSTMNSLVRSKPRVSARITVATRYAAALEYGSAEVRNPPRPLTRLLDRMHEADPRYRG